MSAYTQDRADLVQDLINTYDLFLDEPEHLQTPEDLQHFLEEHGLSLSQAITQADLEEARLLRETLRMAWNSGAAKPMLHILNPLIAASPVTVQFEEGTEPTVHAQFTPEPGLSLVQRMAFDCALGIIDVVRNQGIERMRACASSPCRDVFIDTSRNKSRRFCSDRCANRYNISAFRDRQKK